MGHTACMTKKEMHSALCWRNLMEIDHLEDLGLVVLLKLILHKWDGTA